MTDADLILGYLNADYFLGGEMKLDRVAAVHSVTEKIAKPLGMDPVEAAYGIFTIVNNNMCNAIRFVSVSRGRDPRDYALMAFGGAGPVHAGMQVQDLGIRTIIIPRNAGIFSALGNLVSNFKISKVHSYVRRQAQLDLEELNAIFGQHAERCRAAIGKEAKSEGGDGRALSGHSLCGAGAGSDHSDPITDAARHRSQPPQYFF